MQIETTMLERKRLLEEVHNIAIVGLSPKEDRASNLVARYLLEKGYKIFPVNPGQESILGQKCYANLASIPEKIDVVNVFRASEYIPAIVDETLAIGARYLWLQLGIDNAMAVAKARAGGIMVVVDRCIKIDHKYFDTNKA